MFKDLAGSCFFSKSLQLKIEVSSFRVAGTFLSGDLPWGRRFFYRDSSIYRDLFQIFCCPKLTDELIFCCFASF